MNDRSAVPGIVVNHDVPDALAGGGCVRRQSLGGHALDGRFRFRHEPMNDAEIHLLDSLAQSVTQDLKALVEHQHRHHFAGRHWGETLLAFHDQRHIHPAVAHDWRFDVAILGILKIYSRHEAAVSIVSDVHSAPPSMAAMMDRRVIPRGVARPASQRLNVCSVQHRSRAACAGGRLRRLRHARMSCEKCAVLAAREPVLSGVGVVCGFRFTPILCQPVLAVNHRRSLRQPRQSFHHLHASYVVGANGAAEVLC